MKKIFTLFLIFSLCILNISPALAIRNVKKQENKLDYINLNWWKELHDPYLEDYIIKAVENNQDIKIATLKVEEARQNANLQRSAELPQITLGAMPGIGKLPGSTSTTGSFILPIIASYEVDIFLKNHDKTKSVKKLYEASKLQEKATYIAIVSAVGATYYNIVQVDELIDIQKQIVADRKRIFELQKQRNEHGITSTSDLVKAEKQYILADSNLTELNKSRCVMLTSLATLTGDSPENINEYKRISYKDLKVRKEIPSRVSSQIIINRPDYLVAEKMIEKAGIDVRVAKKEFLPTFNLGGLMGLLTTSGGMPMNWANALAGAGVIGMLPIFTGGRRIASLKLYKNKYEQAIQEYQKTNIVAIKEVNDALSNLQYDKEKFDKNAKALDMEKKDFKMSQSRYNQGTISYLDLLQRQETLLSTQKLTVASDMDIFVSQISLYKATAAANL